MPEKYQRVYRKGQKSRTLALIPPIPVSLFVPRVGEDGKLTSYFFPTSGTIEQLSFLLSADTPVTMTVHFAGVTYQYTIAIQPNERYMAEFSLDVNEGDVIEFSLDGYAENIHITFMYVPHMRMKDIKKAIVVEKSDAKDSVS